MLHDNECVGCCISGSDSLSHAVSQAHASHAQQSTEIDGRRTAEKGWAEVSSYASTNINTILWTKRAHTHVIFHKSTSRFRRAKSMDLFEEIEIAKSRRRTSPDGRLLASDRPNYRYAPSWQFHAKEVFLPGFILLYTVVLSVMLPSRVVRTTVAAFYQR